MQRDPDEKNRKIVRGFSQFLAVLGVLLLLFGAWFVREAMAIRNWPPTTGTLISVSVRSSRSGSSTSRRYKVHLIYRYTVEGKSYTSSRYRLGDGSTAGDFTRREQAREEAKRWEEGQDIKVYYAPDEPKSAVLMRVASWGVYVPIILGLLFGLTGIFAGRSLKPDRGR